MKDYKDYEKIGIGSSDISALLLGGLDEKSELISKYIEFRHDGDYSAYLVDEETRINESFKLLFISHHWLVIYDDIERARQIRGRQIKVYQNPSTKEVIIQTIKD